MASSPKHTEMESRRHELLEGAADTTARTLAQFGIDADLASQAAAAVADALAEDYSGQVIYFPRDAAYALSKRDHEVLKLHHEGRTVRELARQFEMTEIGIKKLLKRAESREPDLNQGKLW